MKSSSQNNNEFERRYSSCNERINILMENFQFFHRTNSEGVNDPKYIFPKGAYEQFSNWLKYNKANSASYLITGFRGAGKTGFVHYVINNLNNKKDIKKKFVPISISLGQENLNEIELLRIVAKRIFDEVSTFWLFKLNEWYKYFSVVIITFLGVLFVVCHFFEYVKNCVGTYLNQWWIWACFLFIYILLPLCLEKFFIGTFTVFHRLKRLCIRLNATVTDEKSTKFSLGIEELIYKLGFSIKKNIMTPPASIQEIEYELIEIFKLLNDVNNGKHYVIIFDELDKIDPKESMIGTSGEQTGKISQEYVGGFDLSESRKRQVLSIIANMKFFLCTAQAYFVFIAGREMYEAFQADMSDRDFSINSIFHGVLNIDSFLSSSREVNNVTAKTEEFVCRQLLPPNFEEKAKSCTIYSRRIFTLKNYYKYRLRECFDFSGCNSFEEYRKYVWRDIWFLYHFISYLSFISNGSPKKMGLFLEKYIRTGKYIENNKEDGIHKLMGSYKKSNKGDMFYLSFGYYSALKINFIHHLTYPIIQHQVNRANMFGDKLLVAASFMISHLFKMHNNGFSWRNIEQMPELQEINKTPEVREYIGYMIEFMNHSYLTTVPYGLFHYKFPMRISEEISFLSKLSGEASAVFNFTSGELQSTIGRYKSLLKQCEGQSHEIDSEYTKASTHHSLGDLHMFEENFSAAIREYEQALELIPSPFKLTDKKWMEKNHLLFLNRTMLKLGLAHEKRHTDNSAYIVYDELVNLLKKCKDYPWVKLLFKDIRTMHLVLLAKLYVLEKLDTEGITHWHIKSACRDFEIIFQNSGKLVKADFYRKLGDILYYKNSKRKSGCLLDYPYTAIECYKKSLLKLLNTNSTLLGNHLDSSKFCSEVYRQVLKIKKHLLCNKKSNIRDYYIYQIALTCENIGHVLIYNANKTSEDNSERLKTLNEFEAFCNNFNNILEGVNKEEQIIPQNHLECSIYYYYIAAILYNFSCERGLSANCYKEILQVFIIYFREVRNDICNKEKLTGCMRKLLDNISREELIALHRQKEYIYLSEENGIKWLKGLEMYDEIDGYDLSLMPEAEEFIFLYYSALIELWETTRSTLILKKIASFYRGPLMSGKRPSQTLTGMISNLQLKGKYNIAILKNLVSFDLGSDPNYCTPRDINKFIKLGIIDESRAKELSEFFPSSQISLFYSQEQTEEMAIKRMDLLDFLVTDTLFCYTRIIEILTPLRNTTLFTNYYKAEAFNRLQKVCHLYKCLYCYYKYRENKYDDVAILKDMEINFQDLSELQKSINTNGRSKALYERAARLTRKSTPSNTHISYLAESAIHYYTRARQVHTEGKTYQEMIRSLYFLDDDLNNDTLQFYLAIERYSFNKGTIRNKEDNLKKIYKDRNIYKLDWYFKTNQ